MARTYVDIPEVSGVVRGGSQGPMAARFDVSVLGACDEVARSADGGAIVVTWSGSFAEMEGGGLFEDDPRTWGPKGWSELEERVRRLRDAGVRVCLRPHARHVVSDPVGCRRLLEAPWAEGVLLMYDPGAMLAESMRGEKVVTDHVRRMYEEIGRFQVERLVGVVRARVEGVSAEFVEGLEGEWVAEGVVCVERKSGGAEERK